MPKFRIYGIITTSKCYGVMEADSAEEAKSQAEDDLEGASVSICHQCADTLGGGDISITEISIEEAGEDEEVDYEASND